MEKSKLSKRNKSRKRTRVKLECLVCHSQFDDDYRPTHNKRFHHEMLKKNKAIPYQDVNAQPNPFVAAKKPCLKSTSQASSSTSPCPGTSQQGNASHPSRTSSCDDHDEPMSEMPIFEEASVFPKATTFATDTSFLPTPLHCEIESEIFPYPGPDNIISIPEPESMVSVSSGSDGETSHIDFVIQTSSESESDAVNADFSTENVDDNWLTCAGELSYLVEDLRRASDLVEEVKGDTCPVVETFLSNAEELTQRVCKNANKIRKLSTALLKKIRENRKVSETNVEASVASVPSHDPGERCKVKTSTDSDKKYLMMLGPHQPKLSVFPKNNDIPRKKQCRFSSVWYTAFPHLEYSISKDAAFCYVCSLFPSGPGREQAENAWSMDGVRQWQKMTSRGTKKKGKLAVHFGSKSHKAALADFYSFSQESSNVDLLLDKETSFKLKRMPTSFKLKRIN